MDGYAHTLEVRVRFVETDAQGIAHNAAYLVWFEVGRVDYLARHAGGYRALRESGIEALVTESHVGTARPRGSTTCYASTCGAWTSAARGSVTSTCSSGTASGSQTAGPRTRPWTRRRSGRPGSPWLVEAISEAESRSSSSSAASPPAS